MPRFPLQLPTGDTLVDAFARELITLLGYNAPDDSHNARDARAIGGSLAEAYERLNEAVDEAFVDRAEQLLSEWEARLGLPVSSSLSADVRQRALLGARRAGAGNQISRMLGALSALDPTVQIDRRRAVDVTEAPRKVFLIDVRVAPAVYADPALRGQLGALIERMKPAHVSVVLSSADAFRTDDPDSLTDTAGDVLGV